MPRGIVIPQVDNSWKWGTGHGRVEPGEYLASRIISTASRSVKGLSGLLSIPSFQIYSLSVVQGSRCRIGHLLGASEYFPERMTRFPPEHHKTPGPQQTMVGRAAGATKQHAKSIIVRTGVTQPRPGRAGENCFNYIHGMPCWSWQPGTLRIAPAPLRCRYNSQHFPACQ